MNIKIRKSAVTDLLIDTPWNVAPASSEFMVTLDETPVHASNKDDSLLLNIHVAEIHEDSKAIEKSLSCLWSTEDESPILGIIKPK